MLINKSYLLTAPNVVAKAQYHRGILLGTDQIRKSLMSRRRDANLTSNPIFLSGFFSNPLFRTLYSGSESS